MGNYKGINLSEKDIKLILKLKKMKKDKKKAKRKVKRNLKLKKEETFFGKNRIGGSVGGFNSGQTHTNTIVVPHNQPQQIQPNNNMRDEYDTRFKRIEDATNQLIAFGNNLMIEPDKKRRPPRRTPIVLPDYYKPMQFIDPIQQQQKEQNINPLNTKEEYITQPKTEPLANTNDNIGGASNKNSSDMFVEESTEIFGAEDITQPDIPQPDIPQPDEKDEKDVIQPDEEIFDNGGGKDENAYEIETYFNTLLPKQKTSFENSAKKRNMDVINYLRSKAVDKGYGDNKEGVKSYVEDRQKLGPKKKTNKEKEK